MLQRRLTPDQSDAIAAVARYIRDRADQYVASSGIHAALCELAWDVAKGEAEAAWLYGELDDDELRTWQRHAERERR
ncbi:MAG TPA: hypothetical protein VGG39_23580 [Polyangiaceae bacterium]|jgi:hypothetical protein